MGLVLIDGGSESANQVRSGLMICYFGGLLRTILLGSEQATVFAMFWVFFNQSFPDGAIMILSRVIFVLLLARRIQISLFVDQRASLECGAVILAQVGHHDTLSCLQLKIIKNRS